MKEYELYKECKCNLNDLVEYIYNNLDNKYIDYASYINLERGEK